MSAVHINARHAGPHPTRDVSKNFLAWRAQHDLLLAAAAGMQDRVPLFVSGGLHSFGVGRITASNGVALAKPIVSVLSGPIGTGRTDFPSAIHGMVAQVPQSIANEELLRPIEENDFTIADFTPGNVTLRCFKWRNAPMEAIDTAGAVL